MPLVPESLVQEIGKKLAAGQEQLKKVRQKAEERSQKVKEVAITAGSGLAAGFIDGRIGGPEGTVTVFGFSFAPSLALGAALSAAGTFEVLGKNSDDAMAAGSGMLAAYLGRVGFNTGVAGKAKGTMFGDDPVMIGNGGYPEIVGPAMSVQPQMAGTHVAGSY